MLLCYNILYVRELGSETQLRAASRQDKEKLSPTQRAFCVCLCRKWDLALRWKVVLLAHQCFVGTSAAGALVCKVLRGDNMKEGQRMDCVPPFFGSSCASG